MKILLTGGCGFIGSNFVRFALGARGDVSIVNLDALTYSGNPENLADLEGDSRYRFVKGDIRDLDLMAELIRECDAVVHMAAESHVDRSIIDARPFIETNVLGTQTLLDALRRADPGNNKRFVHVSTDEVYGSLPLDRPDLLFTEDTPTDPKSPYAASKAASDFLVRAAVHTFGVNACITNCSNNFGPYQFPEKVIPLFVTNLVEGKKVPLYGDGLNVRDWLHVDDHCEAIWQVLLNGRVGESYNIGGDAEMTNLQVVETLCDILDQLKPPPDGVSRKTLITYVQDRPGHDWRYAMDYRKITKELGWSPQYDFASGLRATIQWYLDHADWCQR
ncbi:MAG: dTDP-glucose 4,6-dehydratase, partial [Planctomycetes bacterium]|nr:dTDP-glucose 4,6-dehydratase [Planctomycetota bacterium]